MLESIKIIPSSNSRNEIAKKQELQRIKEIMGIVHKHFYDIIANISNNTIKSENIESLLRSDINRLWDFREWRDLRIADTYIKENFKIKLEEIIWNPIVELSIDSLLLMASINQSTSIIEIRKIISIIREYLLRIDFIVTSFYEKITNYWYHKYTSLKASDYLMELLELRYFISKIWDEIKQKIKEDYDIYLSLTEKEIGLHDRNFVHNGNIVDVLDMYNNYLNPLLEN